MTTFIKIKANHLAQNNKEQLEKYECPKCEHILTDAVQTSCGHWLCFDCAEEVFKKTEGTPYCPRVDCGEELIADEGRPFFPDRFVRKEIGRFVVTCINRKFGCGWEGKLGELGDHFGNCEHKKTECKHCNQAFSPLEYQTHVDQCPKMTFTCPLKEYGCKETKEMTREECNAHLSSGLFNHILLIATALSLSTNPLKSESLESFANLIQSNGGYHGPEDSPAATGRYVTFGFLEDRVVGTGARACDETDAAIIQGLQADVAMLQNQVARLELDGTQANASSLENSVISVIWTIPQFSQRMDDARTGRHTSIFSPPFYSSPYGYKMCLRLYILGDGIGKGTHMSLFFGVMKGEYDALLQWPFTHKVTFELINQSFGHDVVDIFQPDPFSSLFHKPESDMNVASGCPRFVSMNELMQGEFIKDDTIFIKVKVDTTTMRHP